VTIETSVQARLGHSVATRASIASLAALLFLSFVSAGASAQSSSGHDLLPVFPDGDMVESEDIRSSGHLVLFSPVREINDSLRSDVMQRMSVDGSSHLIQIDRDSSRRELRDWYRQQIINRQGQVIFNCEGVSCGRSNVWANRVFGESRLYGRDADQDYLIASFYGPEQTANLLVLYTVTRGNGREYAWVELLEPASTARIPGLGNAGNARVLGPLVLPWSYSISYRFDWNATARRTLDTWAGEDGQVVIVSYAGIESNDSMADAFERASSAASVISELLVKSDIDSARQRQVIIGPAQEQGTAGKSPDRVELFVIRPSR